MGTKQTEDTSKRDGTSRRHNRRQALGLAGVAAAAAAVAAVGMNGGKKAHAATGGNFILGQSNVADQPTVLQADQLTGASLHVENRGGGNRTAILGVSDGGQGDDPQHAGVTGLNEAVGPDAGAGVFGVSQNGWGVFGSTVGAGQAGVGGVTDAPEGFPLPFGPGTGVHGSSGSGPGVKGNSITNAGIWGSSHSGPGVTGDSESGPGIQGVSQSNRGVQGWSDSGPGVAGHSQTAEGVVGSAPGDHPGVVAFSGDLSTSAGPPDGGVALAVLGKAVFSTAGAWVVLAGARSVEVANPAVTDASHVTVTLTGDPGNAAAVVQWVERQPGSGFIVHLRVPVSNETPFTYLIVEPGV